MKLQLVKSLVDNPFRFVTFFLKIKRIHRVCALLLRQRQTPYFKGTQHDNITETHVICLAIVRGFQMRKFGPQ